MSVDGKTALPSGKQMRISSEYDMKRVHQLRNSCDGVLVGVGTVLADDPKLTVKKKYVESVRQPTRIVLDTFCKTPVDALVVNNNAHTIICCQYNHEMKHYGETVEFLFCDTSSPGQLDLSDVLLKLYENGIKTVLVEGGGTTIWSFLRHGLVDDLYIFMRSIIIGGKQTPTTVNGEGILDPTQVIGLDLVDFIQFNEGLLLHYQPS
jgi:2,5-diamino-6-(ribosylamino)-4(3H)-pyrimidinone 5'-phosphate reductase